MGKRADRSVLRLLAAFLLLLAGNGRVVADEFHTPSVSAMRVEWRAALDQFRTEVSGGPAATSTFSFAIQQRVPPSERTAYRSVLVHLAGVEDPGREVMSCHALMWMAG